MKKQGIDFSHFYIFLVLVALLFSAGFVYTALMRMPYPYDLDFIEDAILLQANRVALHQPVFVPPNSDFVPQVYMPLYTWLGGWLFRLTGPALWPLRLLSFLAILGISGLIYYITVRESHHPYLPFITVGLFLAGHRLVGGWYDLARVDSLFVFLTLAGMTVAIYEHHSRIGLMAAGGLMGLAFLTKQNGLFLALVAGGFLLLVEGWRVKWYILVTSLVSAIPVGLLQHHSHGWFTVYTFGIAYASPVSWQRVKTTFIRELWGAMGGVFLCMYPAGVSALIRSRWQVLTKHPWFLFIIAAVLVTVATRASVGGNLNNLIIGYTYLCLTPALLMVEFAQWPATWKKVGYAILPMILLGQFYQTQFNPIPTMPDTLIPTAEMWASGNSLIQRIAAAPGPVWVMLHPYYAMLAGKDPAGAHIQTLWHARWRGSTPLPTDLVAHIVNHDYAMIISDGSAYEMEPALIQLLTTYYRPVTQLSAAQAPPTINGVQTRPKVIYVPNQ